MKRLLMVCAISACASVLFAQNTLKGLEVKEFFQPPFVTTAPTGSCTTAGEKREYIASGVAQTYTCTPIDNSGTCATSCSWATQSGGSFSAASQAEATAGTDNTKGMTPLRTQQWGEANIVPIGGLLRALNGTQIEISPGPTIMTTAGTFTGITGTHVFTGATRTAPFRMGSSSPSGTAGSQGDVYYQSGSDIIWMCPATANPCLWRVKSPAAREVLRWVMGAGTPLTASDAVTVPQEIGLSGVGTMSKCYARFGTAPSGGTTTAVISKNGSTFATINATAATANTASFTGPTLAEGDYFTIAITAVAPTPGQDLFIHCDAQ